jgi:hypothetical protein
MLRISPFLDRAERHERRTGERSSLSPDTGVKSGGRASA